MALEKWRKPNLFWVNRIICVLLVQDKETRLPNLVKKMATMQAIRIKVPVGIPTDDGGLEIPNRIFLGGIPADTTELELEVFFSDYATVKDVRIVTDRKTGECKGYGFVTFETAEDISNLLKKKSIVMKGKRLRIRKAVRRNGSQFQPSPTSAAEEASPPLKPATVFPQPQAQMEPYVLVPMDPSHCMSCNCGKNMGYPVTPSVCQPYCYINPGLVPVQQYNWPMYQLLVNSSARRSMQRCLETKWRHPSFIGVAFGKFSY
eukprot:gene6844-7612_t